MSNDLVNFTKLFLKILNFLFIMLLQHDSAHLTHSHRKYALFAVSSAQLGKYALKIAVFDYAKNRPGKASAVNAGADVT